MTGFGTTPTEIGAFYVQPIRNIGTDLPTATVLQYNSVTSEICFAVKTFVIDHPLDKDKYLVHACLEGPESGVYYRGIARIYNERSVEVSLPEYVKELAYDFTVNITHMFDEENDNEPKIYSASSVKNNKFRIYGPSGSIYWHVYGNRMSIEVEPLKERVNVKGTGPYKWI